MKRGRFWCAILFSWIYQLVNGQSFEIPIYFEDAIGNRDSIILGYDELATYGIDPSFGEINLIDSAYSNDFEVRAAIYDYGWEWGNLPRVIESKKMIIGYICEDSTYFDEANSIMVVIKTDNWPIKITWDKDEFHEACNYIEIIDCTAGGWFDVCGGGHPHMLLEMNMNDLAIYTDTEFKIDIGSDTLSALYFSFFSELETTLSIVNDMRGVSASPNPSNELIQFTSIGIVEHPGLKIKVFNITGSLMGTCKLNEAIDARNWGTGIYFYHVCHGYKIVQIGKLIVTQ